MRVWTTADGVSFSRESSHTRAMNEVVIYRYPRADAIALRDAYLREQQFVLSMFGERWRMAAPKLPESALVAFAQELTLHTLYLCVLKDQPLVITKRHLTQPHTYRILMSHATGFLRAGSGREIAFCEEVLGGVFPTRISSAHMQSGEGPDGRDSGAAST